METKRIDIKTKKFRPKTQIVKDEFETKAIRYLYK